jgi:hypothetical protein
LGTEEPLRTGLPDLPTGSELSEARRYFPDASLEELSNFARRQIRARRRTTILLNFYRRYPCHLSHLHLLGTCAVTLGRFAGCSAEFDEMGEEFMPCDAASVPRPGEWQAYADACSGGRPWPVRDEFWLAAHMKDMARLREIGLEERFYEQAAAHVGDPIWELTNEHVETTLATRLMDRIALDGDVAYETAFAHSLAAGFLRLCTVNWRLVRRYYWEGFRAALLPARASHPELVSYRRTALHAARYCFTAWNASRVYRRGMREQERGRRTSEDGWPLLADVLGERVSEVHPLIVNFYRNPGRFQVRVKVDLHTLPAKFWSRVVTVLIGQGPYEDSDSEVDAQFRVFRRRDGSMHFVRELYMGETLRVFDSDFIVRRVNGLPALFEVFVDQHIEVEMTVTPLPEGALSIRGKNFYYRGLRLPCPGLRVEFQSHVLAEGAGETLQIEGRLLMQPESRWGRFLSCHILRRPEVLGTIRYMARPLAAASANNSFS